MPHEVLGSNMNLQAVIEHVEQYFNQYGYVIVFFSGFIEATPVGWIFPGNTIIAAGGYFAKTGSSSITGIILASWIGSWLVFLLSYMLGRKSGDALITRLKQDKPAARAEELLQKHGGKILSTSLLAGIIRFWIAYMAGAKSYNFIRFCFYTGISTLAWTAGWALLGYILGTQEQLINQVFAGIGILSWAVFIGLAFVLFRHTKDEYKEYKNP